MKLIVKKRVEKDITQILFKEKNGGEIERSQIRDIVRKYIQKGKQHEISAWNNGQIRSGRTFLYDDINDKLFAHKYIFDPSEFYDAKTSSNIVEDDNIRGFVLYIRNVSKKIVDDDD